MELEKTKAFSLDDLAHTEVRNTLREVWDSLREKGYNPTNQIVGYLISGVPGFISSYQDAFFMFSMLIFFPPSAI